MKKIIKKKNKNNKIAVVLFLAVFIVAFAVLSSNFHNTFSLVPEYNGGTILGVSYLQFTSNFANINGPAYLVNLVVNNGGESLSGTAGPSYSTSAGSLSGTINTYTGSTYQTTNPNQQISIDTHLNSLSLNIPYDFSGYSINKMSYTNESLSYTLPNAPFGLVCYSGTKGTAVYIGCYDAFGGASSLQPTLSSFASILSADCSQQYNNGVMTYVSAYQGEGLAYTLQCVQPYLYPIAQVYQPSTGNMNYNISVIFSNQTFSHTLFLTNQNPQSNYNNILYAGVYGFEDSGTGIISTTTAPILLSYVGIVNNAEVPQGKTQFVNPFSTATGIAGSYSQNQPSYEPVPVSELNVNPFYIQSGITDGVYTLSSLQSQIYNNNQQINNLLLPMQPSNPYYNLQYNLASSNASLSETNNASYFPLVQMVAKVSTLGVYQAVAQPKIISYSPNPFVVRDGSQQTLTLTIQNQQAVVGSAYVSGSCGGSEFQTNQFSLPASGSVTEQVNVNAPNNPNKNLNETSACSATAFSSFGIYNSTIYFNAIITPECSTGSIYVNNQNCTNEYSGGGGNQSCLLGYTYQNGQCQIMQEYCNNGILTITPTNQEASYNATSRLWSCSTTINNNNGIGIGWYILAGFGALIIIYLLTKRNGGGGYNNNNYNRRYNRSNNRNNYNNRQGGIF